MIACPEEGTATFLSLIPRDQKLLKELVLEAADAEIISKHRKGSKESLFIMTQTHNLHIFGVIPFVK